MSEPKLDNVVALVTTAGNIHAVIERKFYVTFGAVSVFKDHYIEILVRGSAVSDLEGYARQVMHESFGTKWAFIYSEREFVGQIKEWGYKKLCTIEENDKGYFRAK